MPTIYCRHIRPSGRRCQTPALRGKPLCFHHANANAHHRALHPPDDGTSNILYSLGNDEAAAIRREPLLAEYYANTRGPVILDFPPLEDANAVQLALSMVLTVLGQNRLDPTRAASMLYNLQIASGNARRLTHNESRSVCDIVQDEAGNILAPDEDPQEVKDMELFHEEFDQYVKAEKERLGDDYDGEFEDYDDGIIT